MIPIDRDTQILSHMYDYCNKIHNTVNRFGAHFDIFSEDTDYQDSIAMNLLQIGELVSKLSDILSKRHRLLFPGEISRECAIFWHMTMVLPILKSSRKRF